MLEAGVSTTTFSLSDNIFNGKSQHSFDRFEGDLAFVSHEERPEANLTVGEIILSIFIILVVIGFTVWSFWPQGKPF